MEEVLFRDRKEKRESLQLLSRECLLRGPLDHLALPDYLVLQVCKVPLALVEIQVTGVLPVALVFPERMVFQAPLVQC